MHTKVILHLNIIHHKTHEIVEFDFKSAITDFEEYLNHNSMTWQDDLSINEITILEVKDHYMFIDIDHELTLEALDLVLQQWVIESSYSPHLYDFFGDQSSYLDIVDAIIVNERIIPEVFTHLLKVTILNEHERTFLTEDQRVIQLTPPTIKILGIKEGNTIRPLSNNTLSP